MVKTPLEIKQKSNNLQTSKMEVPKKRGRPPKSATSSVVSSPLSSASTSVINETKKTYSLLTTNTCNTFMLPKKSTIVQLRITKEEVEYYENNGDPNNMTLLDDMVATDPVAYNEYSTSTSVLQKSPEAHTTSAAVAAAQAQKHPLGSIVKSLKIITKDPSVALPVVTPCTFEQRRNLIINSGVQRKVFKLLTAFGNDEWPNYSPYDCWYCCHSFANAPVGIPDKIISDADRYVFKLYGNFCSYNCAARYLNPHANNIDDYACIESNFDLVNADEKSEQMQLLELLCHIETGNPLEEKIKLAGPRLSLAKFGGRKTIEEFRQNFNQHTEYHIYKSPLVPIMYELEEVGSIKAELQKRTVPIDYTRVERAYKKLNDQREQLKNKSVISRILKKSQKGE